MLRPCGDDRVCLRSISGDDGRSWCNPLRTTLPNPLSGLAAFAVGETMCAVYNHTTEHQRYPLSLATSDDWGVSWSPPRHLDTTPPEVSYPAFVVDRRQVAHGVYTFGRSRICYVAFDREWWEQ
jgi:predicted neuraminidase